MGMKQLFSLIEPSILIRNMFEEGSLEWNRSQFDHKPFLKMVLDDVMGAEAPTMRNQKPTAKALFDQWRVREEDRTLILARVSQSVIDCVTFHVPDAGATDAPDYTYDLVGEYDLLVVTPDYIN